MKSPLPPVTYLWSTCIPLTLVYRLLPVPPPLLPLRVFKQHPGNSQIAGALTVQLFFYVTSALNARAALRANELQHNPFIISCAHTRTSFVLGDLWRLLDSLLVLTFHFSALDTIVQTANPRFSPFIGAGRWELSLPALQRLHTVSLDI